MTTSFYLRTFGAATLSADEADRPRPLMGPGKLLALVTYLAVSTQRDATREHIIDLLWADAEPEAARRNLRQALYQMRQLLGEDFLTGEGDVLTLATPLRIDRSEFLTAIEHGDLRRAVNLYTGQFFPAFAAPGGAEFEHWADLERQRLHGIYLRALESLVREAMRQAQAREAVQLARRLRDASPTREGSWRLLLDALAAAGDWIQATAEADACEAALREGGRQPEPATTAAIHATRQTPRPSDTGSAHLVAEMVGREGEFAALTAAWDDARAGHLHHVHIVGSAGIGKTRLLHDFATRIAAVGGTVVQQRANQGERDLPYALAGDLARALATLPGAPGIAPSTAGVLLGLDPALSVRFPAATSSATDGRESLRLRTVALSDLLSAVAAEHPTAVLIDDLHWADPASRQIVAGIGSRAASSPILLVTSTRPVPDTDPPGQPADTLTLRPMTAEHVRLLMSSLAVFPNDLQPDDLVGPLCEATGGVPLMVLETLQLALDREWLTRDESGWHVLDRGAWLRELRSGSALDRRLGTLSSQERRLLLTFATAGTPLDEPVLETMQRRAALGAPAQIHALERSGFVVRHEDGAWEVAHDLVTERVLADAPPEDLAAAHATLGHALADAESQTADRLRIAARHLARAGDRHRLRDVLRQYVVMRRRTGDQRRAMVLAQELFTDDVAPTDMRQMVRALPVRLRLTRPFVAGSAGIGAIAALVAGYLWISAPVGLEIMQRPTFASDLEGRRPAIVEVVDRRGRVSGRARDTVEISIGAGSSDYELQGVTRVPLENGRAVFDDVTISGRSGLLRRRPRITLWFAASGIEPVESDSVITGPEAFTLLLDSATLNHQTLSGDSRTITVAPRDTIKGWVWLTYTVEFGSAAVMSAVVPNWGDRMQNFAAGAALDPIANNDTLTVWVEVHAPEQPGQYWIAIVAATETEPRFVASGTNWRFEEPHWYDGNDIADLGPDEIASLTERGGVWWEWELPIAQDPSVQTGPRRPMVPITSERNRQENWILGMVIEVVVR